MGFEPLDLDRSRARRLAAFADQRAEGLPRPPRDAVEEVFVQAESSLGPAFRTATALPDSDRHAIWEHIMYTSTPAVPVEQSVPGAFRQPAPPAGPRALPQWHAALSLVAVLAFLAAIVGIAYQRIPSGDPERGDMPSFAAQATYDAGGDTTYVLAPAQCTTNDGVFTSDEELATRSLADWPEPRYTPAQPVTAEVGNAVLQTYLRYLRCTFEGMEAMNWSPGTPVTYQDVIPLTSQSYLSERYRYGAFLYESLPPAEQDAVDAFYCLPRAQTILETFPLPVNQHVDQAVLEQAVDGIPTYAALAFTPSDVYRSPDGRYGAIVGSISSADLVALLTGSDATSTPAADQPLDLIFIAFVERDGAYYIDEEFSIAGPASTIPYHDAALRCDGTAG